MDEWQATIKIQEIENGFLVEYGKVWVYYVNAEDVRAGIDEHIKDIFG